MVIISSSHNYTKTDLYTFVTSLNNSGYNDKKIMVVYNCDESTKKYLQDNGWELHQKKLDNIQLVTKRFKDFYDILNNYDDDEQILSVDSRDVYFHKNPQLIKLIDLFIGIDGDYSLEKNDWATKEMLKMYPNEYDTIKDKHHLCAGVVLGKNKIIKNLFKDTFDYTFKSQVKEKKSTVDQMALNIMAYNKYEYSCLSENIVINLSCAQWNGDTEFFIYHQYDRHTGFWKKLKSKINKNLL